MAVAREALLRDHTRALRISSLGWREVAAEADPIGEPGADYFASDGC